jgi:hypothetical protein
MASYPRVTPATLANYQPVIDDPKTSEDANKGWEVDLQSRRFVYDFLSEKFDQSASDALKPAAISDVSVAGKVKGSTSNSGTQQGIVQGTVSTPDLRDDAVNTNKILNNAITTAKIGDDQVTTLKLNNLAVTTAKIQDAGVTTAKMAADSVDANVLKDDATGAAGAVTTDHIRSLAVTQAKIASAAVGPNQLFLGVAQGHLLVADPTLKFQSVALSGAATINAAGVLTLTEGGISVIEEKAANGVSGGGSTATTWNTRGVTVPWVIKFQTVASMINLGLGTGKISFAAAGTYIVRARATGYKCGKNAIRINRFNSGNISQETFNGIAQNSPAAATVSTSSFVEARIVIAAGDYLTIEHWTELTEAVDGFGLAVSSGSGDEIHASVEIQKSV